MKFNLLACPYCQEEGSVFEINQNLTTLFNDTENMHKFKQCDACQRFYNLRTRSRCPNYYSCIIPPSCCPPSPKQKCSNQCSPFLTLLFALVLPWINYKFIRSICRCNKISGSAFTSKRLYLHSKNNT